jgi:hypothetical protein
MLAVLSAKWNYQAANTYLVTGIVADMLFAFFAAFLRALTAVKIF